MFMRSYFLFLTATIRYYRIRPCSHNANFCLFCKKELSTGSHFLVRTIFFNYQKFSKPSPNVKKCRRVVFAGLQFFVRRQSPLFHDDYPWDGHASFIGSSYLANMTNYANKVAKAKNWWLQDFQTFCRQTLQLLFVVLRTGPYTQINIVQIKKSVKRWLPRPRRKTA